MNKHLVGLFRSLYISTAFLTMPLFAGPSQSPQRPVEVRPPSPVDDRSNIVFWPQLEGCQIFTEQMLNDFDTYVERVEAVPYAGASSFRVDVPPNPALTTCMPRLTFRSAAALTDFVKNRQELGQKVDEYAYAWRGKIFYFRDVVLSVHEATLPSEAVFASQFDTGFCDWPVRRYVEASRFWDAGSLVDLKFEGIAPTYFFTQEIDGEEVPVIPEDYGYRVFGITVNASDIGLSCGISIDFVNIEGYLKFLAYRQERQLAATTEIIILRGKPHAVPHRVSITGVAHSTNGSTISN